MKKFKDFLNAYDWSDVFGADSVDDKAELFQTLLAKKVDEFLPEKTIKIHVMINLLPPKK